MPKSNRVLIVDDDKFVLSLLQNALSENYELRTANNGEDAINIASTWLPNMILLDVAMPGRNGYEVCDFLKQQPETNHIPIIFLSARSSLRERMLGYEVGGDDYLVKPCDKELLLAKLDRMSNLMSQKEALQSSYHSAQQTALEAITTTAELGKAIRFIERSYFATTLEKLSEELMIMMLDLQLSASVMFITRENRHFYSSNGKEVAPLEKDLLQMLHSDKRFVDFGCRTQINYPRVALLVKNMPLQDRVRYGRIKDIMPFALGSTDAKVRVIDAEHAFKQQHLALNQAVDTARLSLETIVSSLSNNQREIGDIMTALNTNLSMELQRLGLEEDQEDYILDQFSDASQCIHQTLARGGEIMQSMQNVVQQLELLAVDQYQIITETLTMESIKDAPSSGGDIELF